MIKRYNIVLEEDLVEKAKKYFIEYGGKLSTLINKLIEKWIKEQEDLHNNKK